MMTEDVFNMQQQLWLIMKKLKKKIKILMKLYPITNKYNWYGINVLSDD